MLSPACPDFYSCSQRDPAPWSTASAFNKHRFSSITSVMGVLNGIQDVPPINQDMWICRVKVLGVEAWHSNCINFRGALFNFFPFNFEILVWSHRSNPHLQQSHVLQKCILGLVPSERNRLCVSDHSLQTQAQQVGKKRRIVSGGPQRRVRNINHNWSWVPFKLFLVFNLLS